MVEENFSASSQNHTKRTKRMKPRNKQPPAKLGDTNSVYKDGRQMGECQGLSRKRQNLRVCREKAMKKHDPPLAHMNRCRNRKH